MLLNKNLYYTVVYLFCLGIINCQLDPEDIGKINSFMGELMECRQMPGAAIALIKDNEIAMTQGYGFANIEDQTPVTVDTIFAVASVSKSFTATLLGKLFATSEYGLSWDSVVSEATDGVYFHNGYITNHTMFRDLASHQTGLPRNDAIWILNKFDNRQEIIHRVRFMEPVVQFRSELIYNNLMFDIAMFPLEQLMSSTWEELMTNDLLQPIGMDSTTFYDVAEDTGYSAFATPYGWDIENRDILIALPFDTWSGAGLIGPAGSVSSSVNDMAKWLRFILQGGLLENGTRLMEINDLERLWNPEAAYELNTFTKPAWPVSDSWDSYALGYFTGYYRGYRSYSHGGDLTGYHSEVFFLPDMNIATFFTTNFGGHTLERQFIHEYLADILLGVEPAINASYICEILEDNFPSHLQKQNRKNVHIDDDIIYILEALEFTDDLINFYKNEGIAGMRGLSKSLAYELHDMIESVRNGLYPATRQRESYVGEYGNFLYGNLTVSLTEECGDCLYMEYGQLGQFTLYPTNGTDVFLGVNSNYVVQVTPVVFSGSDANDNALYASPIIFEMSDPPVFQRGLTMEDAPPPPIDICYF